MLKVVDGGADSRSMRMGDAINRYVRARVQMGEITPTYGRRLRFVLGNLDDTFGGRQLSKLSQTDIERWLASRSHLSPGTRRNEFSGVRCFVRWLVQRGYVRRDPMMGMRTPKVPRPAERALTRDETEAIEAVLPDARARAVYALMRWCGLRRAEVLRLEVGDWDRRAGVLQVHGKGDHHRTEPVPPWVAEPLGAYLAETGAKAGPMIRTLDGQRGISHSYLGRLMATWMTEAGVKAAPFDGRNCHALRHTIASELVESGADVRVVQELLGHSSLTSTQIYLRRATARRVLDAMVLARAA